MYLLSPMYFALKIIKHTHNILIHFFYCSKQSLKSLLKITINNLVLENALNDAGPVKVDARKDGLKLSQRRGSRDTLYVRTATVPPFIAPNLIRSNRRHLGYFTIGIAKIVSFSFISAQKCAFQEVTPSMNSLKKPLLEYFERSKKY